MKLTDKEIAALGRAPRHPGRRPDYGKPAPKPTPSPYDPKDLRRLSHADHFWFERKARGMTLGAFAKKLKIGRSRLADYERGAFGKSPIGGSEAYWPPYSVALKLADLAPPKAPPGTPLFLALARRISGLSLDEVARRQGVSRPTVLAREKAGAPEAVAFWIGEGFVFPIKMRVK